MEATFEQLFDDPNPTDFNVQKWRNVWQETFFGALAIIIPLLVLRNFEMKQKQLESDIAVSSQIVELSGIGLVISDRDGVISHANKSFIKTIDQSDTDNTYRDNIFDYYPGHMHEKIKVKIIPEVFRNKQWTGEMRMLTPDGENVPVIESIFPVYNDAGKFQHLVRLITDISEQKKYQQMLKQLSRGIIEAQENERKRVSNELHDSLAQNLLVINSEIQKIINEERRNDERVDAWRKTAKLAEETMEQITDIAFDLRPPALDKLGFEKTITQLADRISDSTNISFFVEIDKGSCTMPQEMEITVYRIIQEAINNIIKHSKADNAYVDVACRERIIEINISDDGIGFEPGKIAERQQAKSGKGLQSITERVAIFGGSFIIESDEGAGSTLSIKLPFDQKQLPSS